MNELVKFNEQECERLFPVKKNLEAMKRGATIKAPRYQRSSIQTTIERIKDVNHKRFSISTVGRNINIKRIL